MIFLVQFCINLHLQVFKKGVIALADSAYEVKNNSCLFERLSKVKENGVFLFAISFFILEIFTFLYYANEGNDDVIDRSTKTVQHSIKNISGNIKTSDSIEPNDTDLELNAIGKRVTHFLRYSSLKCSKQTFIQFAWRL